jgi:hypothetical protein
MESRSGAGCDFPRITVPPRACITATSGLRKRTLVTSHTRRVPHVQFECPIGRDMCIDQRRESAEVVW